MDMQAIRHAAMAGKPASMAGFLFPGIASATTGKVK